MTADEFPRRHPLVSFRPMGDEGGLVVLPTQQEIKVLNAVGIKVFSMLDGTHSLGQIARAVADEFGVNLQRAERDVRAFLDDLGRSGMLAGKAGGADDADGKSPPDAAGEAN